MKKSNASAIQVLIIPSLLGVAFVTSLFSTIPLYIGLGQICGVIFLSQIFILQHEFGHNSLFKDSKLNSIGGHISSFFTLIPFFNWKLIHDLHHKWTGFRDKDPTTEKTFKSLLPQKTQKIVNFCWKWNIPVFTFGYRFGIYWSDDKLKRFLSRENYKRAKLYIIIYCAFYGLLIMLFPLVILKAFPALILSFILTDIISLSQHSHIQMKHSQGEDVSPLKYKDQAQYTRSLIASEWFSKYIMFNFNRHIEHHMYPGLPCYHLDKIDATEGVQFEMSKWVVAAKSLNGTDFIFSSGKYDI